MTDQELRRLGGHWPAAVAAAIARQRFAFARVILWIVMTVSLTLDRRDDLGSFIPGDPGDSYLVLALLQWGADRAGHLFAGFWDGPIFAGASGAMAYSDTFLGVAVPFAVLETLTGSAVIAFNVLFVLAWVLCGEATYALAHRLITSRPAAVAVAAAFTFSAVRVNGGNHFQLAWAGLIPLSLIALFRFWEVPSARRGALLAGAVVAQFLTSAYYGVVILVVIGGAVAISAVVEVARREMRARWLGYTIFFGAVGVPMALLRHRYAAVQGTITTRPPYPAPFVTRLGDFRAPPLGTRWLDSVWFLSAESSMRSPENHAYVGFLALVGVPVLVVLLIGRRHQIAALAARHRPRFVVAREWLVVTAMGALALGIALGRTRVVGVRIPVYDLARRGIPGVEDMVALGRLVVFTQLTLVLAAGLGLAWVLERVTWRAARSAICVSLVVIVGAEAATRVPMIEVIHPRPGSVNEFLQSAGSGNVALLPMPSPVADGIMHPFVEAPRMVLGADDDLRSVNGYSGYAPLDYEDTVDALNGFPNPIAVAELRRRDVRFVVIYTAGPEFQGTLVDDAINASGVASWPTAEAERRIRSAPPGLVVARHDGVDGVVLQIQP